MAGGIDDGGAAAAARGAPARAARTLAMVNACVQAMIRASDEPGMMDAICARAAELGGFRLAWVGIADHGPDRAVRAVARAGPAAAYIDGLHLTWADEPRGRGPTGRAVRTGRPWVCRDLMGDPDFAPWREQARQFQLAASVALPLHHDGVPLGVLSLYAGTVDAFDADELALLQELADTLAFGLAALRRRLERDAALRELADKSMLLARAEAVAHIGSWRLELATGRLICSDEIYAIVGVDRTEFVHDIRASLIQLVHPEDLPTATALIVAALDDGVPRPVTCRVIRPDGEIRWVHAAGETVRDAAGRGVALIGYLQDITDRRRIEDGLRQTSMAVEQSPVAIEVTGIDGTIEYVNPWFTRVTGYAAAEVIGQHARILKSGHTPPERYDELWATIRAGQVWEGELQNRRKDGGLFWEHATISPLRNAAGEVTHYVAVKEDITARKAADAAQALLQAELAQAQKLESVGRLAGGVAHDFNNMLGAILGLTELVMLDLGPGHASYGDLVDIRSAAQRSAELTRQLLSFARRQPIRPQVVDLNDAVGGMLKLLRRLIGEDIELAWHPAAALWPVEVDPSQIDQILANLAVNARDAIAGVGRLTLATANVDVDAARAARTPEARPGAYVRLTVADTGCGMDADVLAHMFEPFFTTKEPGKGTGLGAATVYGIVK
ncbi:MAG: PAS domain S-box protein [Myxococcales bacterium]|nr:PAS domain S-box protein [Myxococcales bacterium]